ncbi:MAG: DUF3343 domain-containing protein [Clostridia bacterium]|nr:DUF3343 domain-containing protein [Clostridia bacterium]
MELRTIVTGSQTSAIKAKRHLEKGGIIAQVVRAPKYAEGCRFGIELLLADLPHAISLLREARIEYTEILKT